MRRTADQVGATGSAGRLAGLLSAHGPQSHDVGLEESDGDGAIDGRCARTAAGWARRATSIRRGRDDGTPGLPAEPGKRRLNEPCAELPGMPVL